MRAFLLAAVFGTFAAFGAGAQVAAPPAAPPSTSLPSLALTAEQLDALPRHEATIAFGNPSAPHVFAGPLLWDVLTASGVVDPDRHGVAVRQVLLLRGADGYTATVALAEVAPAFANRPAILATTMDGVALGTPRAVMPGEGRAGRSVRDLVAVTVQTLGENR